MSQLDLKPKAKAVLTSLLAIAALGVIALTVAILGELERPTPATPADELVIYLDRNAINYGTERELFELADDLCELKQVGADTAEFLTNEGWSMHDVSYWQWGVFNGGYCDG